MNNKKNKKSFQKIQHLYDGGNIVDTSGLDPITAGGQQAIARGTQQIQEKLKALQQFGSSALSPNRNLPPDDPSQFMNGGAGSNSKQAALANQDQYERQLKQRLQQNAATENAQQQKQNALDEPIDESGYTNYAQGGEVASDGYVSPPSAYPSSDYSDDDEISKPSRFEKLRGSMTATSEQDASKDPMEFIKKNKNMSIKGKRGVPF